MVSEEGQVEPGCCRYVKWEKCKKWDETRVLDNSRSDEALNKCLVDGKPRFPEGPAANGRHVEIIQRMSLV